VAFRRCPELADQAKRVLRNALDSFTETDLAKAKGVLGADDEIDLTEDRLIQAVIADVVGHPERVHQEVDFILIAKNPRGGDHATNIAEEIIFLAEARIVRHQEKLGGALRSR
jgi:phosphate transport system protein